MGVGPTIRRMFGRHERRISEAYRSLYVDLDAVAGRIADWQPVATKILEVGCGEGAVTERLCAAFPEASITAIDVTPTIGRLYQGPRDRVRFRCCDVQEMVATEAGQFDLVVLCDVLHHVPVGVRQALLDAARTALAPGGSFVFKDWEPNFSLIHWLCYMSDRWVTGDRSTRYMTRDEMRASLALSFGAGALVAEARLVPWNNIALLVRP